MKPGSFLARSSLILIGILFISCGKKSPPVSPQAVIPAPITGVEYRLDEAGATLTWKSPVRTEQGKKMEKIQSFILERAEYQSSDFCKNCPVHYNITATISAAELSAEQRRQPSYRDEDLRPDHIYLYRVRTSMGWQITSLPSEPVSFTWQLPVEAVSGLKADSGDQQINLNWQPPTMGLDGSPVTEPLRYQVFRSVSGDRFLPLDKPVTDLYFKDDQVALGVAYQYKVRASRLSGGTGAFSFPVEATPVDMTPPPAPQGLNTLTTPEGTKLFWEPVEAPDLAGYKIFRRAENEELRLIGTINAPKNSFIDQSTGEQQIYYYRLKAFDQADPANISPFSEESRTGR